MAMNIDYYEDRMRYEREMQMRQMQAMAQNNSIASQIYGGVGQGYSGSQSQEAPKQAPQKPEPNPVLLLLEE